jgi:site-specific recombinase XerD
VVYVVPDNGLDPLKEIQRAHVELYIRHLGDCGLMDSSVNTTMHAVRGFFRFAQIDGLIRSPRDAYRMVVRIAKVAKIPRHVSPHSLRHAAITNALDAGVPLRDAQILARHADPRTTEHYDRARGNLDRHGVHFLTASPVSERR